MRTPSRIRVPRPSAGAAIGMVALCVALAPAAEAGSQAVFAKNAGKVNGIRASKTPKPKQLVPLDSKGKFPKSVIPSPGTTPPHPGQSAQDGHAGPQAP